METAEHAAATVSAARRADDLLGNGNPSGDVTGRRDEGGAWTVCRYLWGGGRCDARRGRWTGCGWGQPGEQVSADFYARQSPAWPSHLSRFRPCTAADAEMKWASWV
ncbi:hypothetical protein GCM10010384_50360 [Streptomyces djakartensis]|uniref:Uncharacterized protein n=1 Tax=Streptomyces djakartensis TaxID=68193 RepID=A0ABQ3A676_9ACTN|nr:hypothetical protein GCM10010384_50360 [Streptomyces djakartensis]